MWPLKPGPLSCLLSFSAALPAASFLPSLKGTPDLNLTSPSCPDHPNHWPHYPPTQALGPPRPPTLFKLRSRWNPHVQGAQMTQTGLKDFVILSSGIWGAPVLPSIVLLASRSAPRPHLPFSLASSAQAAPDGA